MNRKFLKVLALVSVLVTIPPKLLAVSKHANGFYIKGFYSPVIIGSQEFENAGIDYVLAVQEINNGDTTTDAVQGDISGEYIPGFDWHWQRAGLGIGYLYRCGLN